MDVPTRRPSWDEYFMEIATLVATRSTCLRRQVGAVFVKHRNILATGYNGVPSGITHCSVVGCLREKLGIPSGERHEICRGLHAEQNGIIQAAKHGIFLSGSTVYTTDHPCAICAKMLINVGAERVVCGQGYPDQLSSEMVAEAGLIVEFYGGDGK
ncbi:MAG: cytidine/deoxycytidylate deaminase family protein [bacterium]|nr:cytidine/deoxycytidylate deaminase family protein [bacterium]MDT8396202.1 cytidine/deoxycytidylate deaminase family protein [bacterium]